MIDKKPFEQHRTFDYIDIPGFTNKIPEKNKVPKILELYLKSHFSMYKKESADKTIDENQNHSQKTPVFDCVFQSEPLIWCSQRTVYTYQIGFLNKVPKILELYFFQEFYFFCECRM